MSFPPLLKISIGVGQNQIIFSACRMILDLDLTTSDLRILRHEEMNDEQFSQSYSGLAVNFLG